MPKLTLTAAFARYGATLANPQWAVSSISPAGELVVSCWEHYFSPHNGGLSYRDRLSRWPGNRSGNNLLRQHLLQAQEQDLPIRLVIAHAKDTARIDAGEDASLVQKTFDAREDLVGKVIEFDGDHLVIDFRRRES